jgi:hypothetical protein
VACHNFQEISSLQKKELIPGIVRKLLWRKHNDGRAG